MAAAHSRPDTPRLSCFRDVLAELLDLLARGAVAGQVELGEPHRAEGKRQGQLDQAVHRADQLEAAAADVGDEGPLAGQPEVVGHGAVRERRLGLRVDDPERDVELLPDPADEPRPFSASRTAAVATAEMRVTPRRWHTSRMRASVWMRALDRRARRGSRWSASPAARRGWSFISSMTERPGGGIVLGHEQAGRSWSRRRWRRCARGRPGPPAGSLRGRAGRSRARCGRDARRTRAPRRGPRRDA